jgi:HD-GYP domain-containing protein (c-di-GMP phosphodiesterase class II)
MLQSESSGIVENEKTHCLWCSKPVVDAMHVTDEGEVFCCEGCFLGYTVHEHSRRERDEIQLSLVEALAAALDAREHETGMHSQRVACHTQILARRFTDDKDTLQQIYWGALLHDIGKIAIPDVILLKAGPLTEDEWDIMRSHPQRGHDIINTIPFINEAADIVLCHEERWDGSGYPQGLKGEGIPWGARLFAVIDALDAMTSDRPYRKAQCFDVAKAEIIKMSGHQFDPKTVEVFLAEEKVLRGMVDVKCAITPEA